MPVTSYVHQVTDAERRATGVEHDRTARRKAVLPNCAAQRHKRQNCLKRRTDRTKSNRDVAAMGSNVHTAPTQNVLNPFCFALL